MTASKMVVLIVLAWAGLAALILAMWHQHRSVIAEQDARRRHEGATQREHTDPLRTATWTDADERPFWNEVQR